MVNVPDGSAGSAAPARDLLDDWEHSRLHRDLREAIACLPMYFRTETHVSGIMATDLHTLNTVLGATIEEQVVRTLNLVRNTWDPDEQYSSYSFVRQAQTFPDVRRTKQHTDIEAPEGVTPYPNKSHRILDRPLADDGGNFGRLARTGMMDTYMRKLDDLQLCGIKTVYWREFLKIFQEGTTDNQAHTALERLRRRVRKAQDIPPAKAHSTLAIIAEIERLLDTN